VFTLGRNFHVIHMSDDIAALDAWYDDVFSVNRWVTNSLSPELRRIASLVGIGNLCIEPMQPAFDLDGWETVPLGRFYRRWGRQWHSIAWYVDDVEGLTELRDRLEAADVELLGLLGGRLEHDADAPEDRPIFTHPNSTLTQLEFMVPPTEFMFDPRLHVSYRATWWHDTHPLHIRKHSHFTLATRDLDHARKIYVDVIGGKVIHEGQNDLLKTRSIYVAVGHDDIVELAQPLESATPIADYVDTNHHGLFSVSLQVEDLGAATRYLTSKAIAARAQDSETFLSDPATTHGVHWAFTTAEIPHDTRPAW
jgi:catechol 2,3-dioxygenase-like lactoylglutathione lyase family enzyme